MTLDEPAAQRDQDLDKDERLDKWRTAVVILAFLLVGLGIWLFMSQVNSSNKQAASEASQKYTLAQQVAAACAISKNADDLGGLCPTADQIVEQGPAGSAGIQGPPGDVGPQGPFGAKGEQGVQGVQGIPGPMGLQGIQGVFGKDGITGLSGADGVSGTNGADGVSGTNGADGVQGPPGADGVNGANGADGATGPAGPVAFPFSFSFTTADDSFDCTITAQDAVALCTASAP